MIAASTPRMRCASSVTRGKIRRFEKIEARRRAFDRVVFAHIAAGLRLSQIGVYGTGSARHAFKNTVFKSAPAIATHTR
jgi:hypothetical protein